MELEDNNSINFLDLTITKCNNKLNFAIFHKPTHTDMVIHNTSTHPYSHKLAAFHSYIHRLFSIPLSDSNFQSELNIIKQIASNNGYQPNLIDHLLNKKFYSQALKLVYPLSPKVKRFHTLAYIGNASDKICKYFKQKNVNIAFKALSRYALSRF